MDRGLLDSKDYELIKSMSLLVKRRAAGFASGEQRSSSLGGGIEFADYREYIPGDDLRQIDWPVFLRMRKLLTRLCAEEKELTLVVLLDLSRSMDSGEPSKLITGKRVACVLAGLALQNGNRAGICAIGKGLMEPLRPERNRLSLSALAHVVSRLEPQEAFTPAAAMRQFAARYGRKCVAVLISDLLYDEWPQTLSGLAATGCEAYVAQILSPDEIDPTQRGEITLVDSETDEETPLHADLKTLSLYQAEVTAFLSATRSAAGRLGLGHSLLVSDRSLERLFREDLRKGGLVC
jgi:uncharacterized protein (DUF58 family)